MRFGQSLILLLAVAHGTRASSDKHTADVINRRLETSIKAHSWPTTASSPLCEAFAYIDSAPTSNDASNGEGSSHKTYQSWKQSYFESLTDSSSSSSTSSESETDEAGPSYHTGIQKALNAAQTFFLDDSTTEEMDFKLLTYALATRAHAPLCEMHRSLAQAALGVFPDPSSASAQRALMQGAFVIVSNGMEGSYDYAIGVDANGHPDFINGVHVPDVVGKPLPGEESIYEHHQGKEVAVLYGSFDSPSFAALYHALKEQGIPFVVRHLDAVQLPDGTASTSTSTSTSASNVDGTALQGYGVRLDIRNVEYKSFDDKADSKDESSISLTSTNSAKYDHSNSEELKDLFTNGIDPIALIQSSPQVNQFLNDYLPNLNIVSDDATTSYDRVTIPPKSELTNLPMQATHVISQSKDPLWTMQQLSQNLPSFASALGNVTVPLDISRQIVRARKGHGMNPRSRSSMMSFQVNGRTIDVDRPAFNLFDLINVIREEMELMKSVDELGLNDDAKSVAAHFLSMGKEDFAQLSAMEDGEQVAATTGDPEPKLRIDVGSGYRGAVIYLNDIEKDKDYADYPTNVYQALHSMQFRGFLSIRRNALTFLVVLDPFDIKDEQLETLGMLAQMSRSGFALRVGVVVATGEDIENCKNLRKSDPDDECLTSSDTSENMEADILLNAMTADGYTKVLQQVIKLYGPTMGIPFLYLTLGELNTSVTWREFSSIYSQFLQAVGAPVGNPLSFISETVGQMDSNDFRGAVKFAVKKNIEPGMAFVNGIPAPLDSAEDTQEVIIEEMRNIAGMMASGQITDASPRSIYAMILKDPKVRGSMHPLLSEESPQYKTRSNVIDSGSILKLTASENSKRPTILFEADTDLVSLEGLKSTLSFLKSLSATKDNMKNLDEKKQTSIAVRVSPSNLESSKSSLAAIFRRSDQFDIGTLIEYVQNAIRHTEANEALDVDVYSHSALATKIILEDQCISGEGICSFESIPSEYVSSTLFYVNGRVFNPKTLIDADDIEILISLERGAAKSVAERLALVSSESENIPIVARITSFLMKKYSSEDFAANERSKVPTPYGDNIIDSMLHFTWNNEEDNNTKVKISVVLDPLSDATQRISPLLRIVRDTLKLPLELVLFPRDYLNEDSSLPLTSYYRFVAGETNFEMNDNNFSKAYFEGLPTNQVLTIRVDVPEPWDIQQSSVTQDTDNLRCDTQSCGDDAYASSLRKNRGEEVDPDLSFSHLTEVEYSLNNLLFSGQCYDVSDESPPNGLQLTLSNMISSEAKKQNGATFGISPDGSISDLSSNNISRSEPLTGTLVMKTVGYWQLRSKPGIWQLNIADNTRGADMYKIVEGTVRNGRIERQDSNNGPSDAKMLIMKDFSNPMELILVDRNKGYETEELLVSTDTDEESDDDTVHVFSLATGHLYERFLKIMMLSVTKRTSTRVKFWFLENFLSPSFKESAFAMAAEIGCEVEFVTYKWPEWLRAQSEKQRIIWGYKILFLDVLFPLNLKRIIYVDADQVVRGDLKELWDMDLEGAPYGYTPMCESREETKGYRFWNQGFWTEHLRGRPYHISALYVVDLQRFRRELVGDQLRSVYQQLTSDPNNLSNLDQDLPNYVQHQIRIFSLPQDWLWCESWCSDETKSTAKTIDLCNNPEHKEPKVLMAKRIISGELFEESWVDLDAEVDAYERKYLSSQLSL